MASGGWPEIRGQELGKRRQRRQEPGRPSPGANGKLHSPALWARAVDPVLGNLSWAQQALKPQPRTRGHVRILGETKFLFCWGFRRVCPMETK